jgi:hypothetical protein
MNSLVTTAKRLVVSMVLIVPAAMLCGGCAGYTMADQYRPGIKTVAVDMWGRGKDVYRRELEMRITEAVVKRIEQDTPYKVTTKARADTLLTGSLDNVEQRTLSFDTDTGLARETEMTFTVSFVWKYLRSGQTLVEKKGMKVSASYTRQNPLQEDFFQGSENTINRLAEEVVQKMEKPW